MFTSERLMAILFQSWLLYFGSVYGELNTCGSGYDITEFISQLSLQFCTFVEVGQGYCSMFVEFRKFPTSGIVSPHHVAEVYLGTCECSTMRDWELCSIPLRKSRPYECYLDDLEPSRRNGSARVHRRLCDPTKIYELNQPCDCTASFAQRTLYPVTGFLTCYRAPLPRSICSTHSVCGVYNCDARNFFGLSLVQCDPLCLGKQPFCEEVGPVTSRPPVVTSYWSGWTCPHSDDVIDVSEAICVDEETNSPAFDCLGPGSYCCPDNVKDCHCEVTTTMAEMKVTRFIFKDGIDLRKRLVVRSIIGKSWQLFKEKLNRVKNENDTSINNLGLTDFKMPKINLPEEHMYREHTNNIVESNIVFEPLVKTLKDQDLIETNTSINCAAKSKLQESTSMQSYMVIKFESVTTGGVLSSNAEEHESN